MKHSPEDIEAFVTQHRERLLKLCEAARATAASLGDVVLDQVDDEQLMRIMVDTLDLIKREAN